MDAMQKEILARETREQGQRAALNKLQDKLEQVEAQFAMQKSQLETEIQAGREDAATMQAMCVLNEFGTKVGWVEDRTGNVGQSSGSSTGARGGHGHLEGLGGAKTVGGAGRDSNRRRSRSR